MGLPWKKMVFILDDELPHIGNKSERALWRITTEKKDKSFHWEAGGGGGELSWYVYLCCHFGLLWEILKATSLELETWQEDKSKCCPTSIQVVTNMMATGVIFFSEMFEHGVL